ncbi:hypothetical protein B0H14DRAFT_2363762, partial [Mycena olivaceomarginata]
IWYILSNIPNDYKLVSEHRMGPATVVYFFSRQTTSRRNANICLELRLCSYPLGRCQLRQTLVGALYAIAVPANCLRFFLRARAIFNRNTYLVLFFFVLWLSAAPSAAAIPTAVGAINIGTTRFCLNVSSRSYIGAPGITQIIHETTIFLVTSWRLLQASHTDHGFRQNFRVFMTGQYLPDFSRAVLKDG